MMDKLAIFNKVLFLRGIMSNRCGGAWEEGMCVYLGRSRCMLTNDNPSSDGRLNNEKSAEVIVPMVRSDEGTGKDRTAVRHFRQKKRIPCHEN